MKVDRPFPPLVPGGDVELGDPPAAAEAHLANADDHRRSVGTPGSPSRRILEGEVGCAVPVEVLQPEVEGGKREEVGAEGGQRLEGVASTRARAAGPDHFTSPL